MVARIILLLVVILSFWVDALIVKEISIGSGIVFLIICEIVLTIFKVIASIWIYKDSVGWDKFENSEGLSIKRKK